MKPFLPQLVLRYLYPPGRMEQLTQAMQSGFGNAAAAKVEELKLDLQAEETAEAAWLLSYWNRVKGDYKSALDHLLIRRWAYPQARWETSQIVVEIEGLLKLGHVDTASRIIKSAVKEVGENTELCFCAANVIGADVQSTQMQADRLRLIWLNKPLIAAGLAPIRLKHSAKSLCIDNIWAPSEVHNPQSGGAKISVLMPAYNAEDTIALAIESVLSQTWRELELLITDDGSDDDTWSIIQSFANRDRRVVPIRHCQNRGAYAARNTALSHATGDFVTVHDSDDWSHPQKMALQVASLLAKNEVANATNKVRVDRWLQIGNRPHGGMLNECYASLMMPRHAIVELGGWDECRMGADAELWKRYLVKHQAEKKILKPEIAMSFYLIRTDSLTNQSTTGLTTTNFGARRQYAEAYNYWHEIERLKPVPDWSMGKVRRFPVPAICKHGATMTSVYDVLLVSDFSRKGSMAEWNADLVRRVHRLGLRCACFHWPRLECAGLDVASEVRKLLHEEIADNVVSGELIECKLTIVSDGAVLDCVPDTLPIVRTRATIVILEGADAGGEIPATNARTSFGVAPQFTPITGVEQALTELRSQLAREDSCHRGEADSPEAFV